MVVEREREGEKEREKEFCACVYVCVRERDKGREGVFEMELRDQPCTIKCEDYF
jgi:hypothetical protein